MTDTSPPNRCRLILIAPLDEGADTFGPRLVDAVAGGDVASLVIPARPDEASFQAFAEPIVRIAQEAGLAAMFAVDFSIFKKTSTAASAFCLNMSMPEMRLEQRLSGDSAHEDVAQSQQSVSS